MIDANQAKQRVAVAAREYVAQTLSPGAILGVGSGTTAMAFIAELATLRERLGGAVASSEATRAALTAIGIPVLDLNDTGELPLYVDGADEIDGALHAIKGGGGAHTREKIVAAASREFLCIADASKSVVRLGARPIPVEVLPMARAYVARTIVETLNGKRVELRPGFLTDNGNPVLDVYGLALGDPATNRRCEAELEAIVGVVACGLFARRGADRLLLANDETIITYRCEQR